MNQVFKRSSKVVDMFWFKGHKNLHLVYIDKIVIILTCLFLALFLRADLGIIVIFTFLIPYSYFTNRVALLRVLGVAFFVSLAWMGFAKEMYDYSRGFLVVFGINLYALFSWTCGLFAVYVMYLHYEGILKKYSFWIRFLIFSVFYIIVLLFFEWIFYNFFGIQNSTTLTYSGILFCNCLHAPPWMQIGYLLLGPVYFLIMSVVKFKNPHFTS